MNKEQLDAIANRKTTCHPFGETVSLSRAERDQLVAMARYAVAIDRAATELPIGYYIELSIECGYGGARLIDPDGEPTELDWDERDLPAEINAGIDAAMAAEIGKNMEEM
ncbi:hypothetical protein ACOTET_29695 [Achromobacter xylosoxidans]|uniref:hypothetical protein n=1 Tax=Achromobacter sp. CSND-B12 TaxID=3462570 RepID=UPI003BA42826